MLLPTLSSCQAALLPSYLLYQQLLQVLLEVWGESDTLEGLREVLAAYPAGEKAKWGGPDQVRGLDGVNRCRPAEKLPLVSWSGRPLFCAKQVFGRCVWSH